MDEPKLYTKHDIDMLKAAIDAIELGITGDAWGIIITKYSESIEASLCSIPDKKFNMASDLYNKFHPIDKVFVKMKELFLEHLSENSE